MSVKVRIPSPLKQLTNNQATVTAEGTDIESLLEDLDRRFPGMKGRLCDGTGALRPSVVLYVNNEDIRFFEGEKTKLKDGDEVAIVPSVAGG